MKKYLIILGVFAAIAAGVLALSVQSQHEEDRDAKRAAALNEWRDAFAQFKQSRGRYPIIDGELGAGVTTGGFQEAGVQKSLPPRAQDRFVYATNGDGSVYVLCTKIEKGSHEALFVTPEDDFHAGAKGCHTNITAEFAQYVKTSGMSDHAAALLYDHDPQIVSKTFIQGRCSDAVHGTSQVQGCYDGQKIYVIDLERPELLDEMQVSTAHEVLHAGYEELDDKERDALNRELQAAAAKIDDPELKQHLDQYDGNLHLDELHSVLGTEYADLGPALEEHYQRYFEDRSKVLAIHATYKKLIDGLKAEIERRKTELDGLGSRADALLAAQRISEYNALVGPYNAKVEQLNALIDRYNALTEHTRPESREAPAGRR